MSIYLTQTFAVTTTPQVVVAADAHTDRNLLLFPSSGTVAVGFTTTDAVVLPQGFGGSGVLPTQFVLPAGHDLYSWTSTGSAAIGVIATKVVE